MSDLYDLCIHKRAWTCSEIVPTNDDSKEKENASGLCVEFALIDFKGALEGFYKNQNLWTEKKAFCLSKGFGHPYLEKTDHNKDVESECAGFEKLVEDTLKNRENFKTFKNYLKHPASLGFCLYL